MRITSIAAAIVVMVTIYLVVIERDTLFALAGIDAEDAAETGASGGDGDSASAGQDSDAGSDADADAEGEIIRVIAIRSVAREIEAPVVLRGETRAIRSVEVRAETSAAVVSEPLRKGSSVKRGDVLCRLDPGTRDSDLTQAKARLEEARARIPESEARLEEARARLAEARLSRDAADKLIEKGYVSEAQQISAKAQYRSAEAAIKAAESGLKSTRAGIEAAEAAVARAEREIQRLEITAPFDGLLESDTAELGSLMQPGALCATVIQLDQIKLVGYVPEISVARISTGVEAMAQLATGQEVTGKVSFLSRSADPLTRTFEVEILADNSDLSIRDGQTAEIMISAAGNKAHLVPQSALTLDNDGLLGVRYVGDGNIVGFAPAEVIQDTTEGAWISGLPETANVIVVGQDFVTRGVEVAPVYATLAELGAIQ